MSSAGSARAAVLDRLRRVPLLGVGLVKLTDIVVTRELVGSPPGLKAGRFVPR